MLKLLTALLQATRTNFSPLRESATLCPVCLSRDEGLRIPKASHLLVLGALAAPETTPKIPNSMQFGFVRAEHLS